MLTLQGLAPSRDKIGRRPDRQAAGAAGQPQSCRVRDRESHAGSSWRERLNANEVEFLVKKKKLKIFTLTQKQPSPSLSALEVVRPPTKMLFPLHDPLFASLQANPLGSKRGQC